MRRSWKGPRAKRARIYPPKTIDESLNITTDDRKEISKKLLDYFSVMNYTNERIEILKSAKKRENTETSLESFME